MTRLAVLFTQGFADWECAHLLATARSYFDVEIVVASPDGRAVISSGGVTIVPGAAMSALDPARIDGLVVCGGTIWQSQDPPDIAQPARAFAHDGKLVAGICDGVLALARTGVLDEVAHTGNARADFKAVPGYNGYARFSESARAVRDGPFVTASGLAPVSFMAETIRALGHGGDPLDAYLGMLAAEHAGRVGEANQR